MKNNGSNISLHWQQKYEQQVGYKTSLRSSNTIENCVCY